MKILTSWDDGNKLDFKTVELLKKYKLPGIFFIPNYSSYTNMLTSDIRTLVKYGFEVGGHTKTHSQDLKRLTDSKQRYEIVSNKHWLENILGKSIKWFCYPRGRYNEKTMEIVKEAGYKYARTTLVGYYKEPENNYRFHPSVHAYPDRKEYEGKDWVDYAIDMFLKAKEVDGIFHLWGHSWEVEAYDLWRDLETIFRFINKNK